MHDTHAHGCGRQQRVHVTGDIARVGFDARLDAIGADQLPSVLLGRAEIQARVLGEIRWMVRALDK